MSVCLEAWAANTVLSEPLRRCVSLSSIEALPEGRHTIEQRIILLLVIGVVALPRAALGTVLADAALLQFVRIRVH